MKCSEKLSHLRKQKKISQQELAKKLGISVNAIRNYENTNQDRIPKLDIICKFTNFYNVPLEYLLNDSVENTCADNISIEKELGLNDYSILTIKDIKEDNLEKELNLFIEKINPHQIVKRIKIIRLSEENIIPKIKILYCLPEFSQLFKKNLKKNLDNKISRLFGFFNKTMSELRKYLESTDEFEEIITYEQIESLKTSLDNIQIKFLEGNLENFQESVINYENTCKSIFKIFNQNINLNKYLIQNSIINFLNELSTNNLDLEHNKLIDNTDIKKIIENSIK